jgi:hypothetical protein
MKKLILPIAVLAISLLGTLTGVPIANAASPYDGMFDNQSDLTLTTQYCPTPYNTHDFSVDWFEYATDATKSVYTGDPYGNELTMDAMRTALSNGGYFFIEKFQPDRFRVYFSYDSNAKLEFRENPQNAGYYEGNLVSTNDSNNIGSIVVMSKVDAYYPSGCGDGEWTQAQRDYDTGSTVFAKMRTVGYGGLSGDSHKKVWMSTFPVTYPNGYEGTVLSDGGASVAPLDEKPQIEMDSMIDWHGSFSEQRFYAFDVPPFLCTDGFPPRMNIELWDKTDEANRTLIVSEQVSSNSKLDYDFPRVYEVRKYEIVSWFSCTDGTLFVEPGASFYEFEITQAGQLGTTVSMENCLTQDYPFITWDGCKDNIAMVTDALTFGTVKLGNDYNFNNQCRTLGTIGDWMNLDNKTVCPVMPESVRNIITPFITFALGLMTIKFIASKTGSSM